MQLGASVVEKKPAAIPHPRGDGQGRSSFAPAEVQDFLGRVLPSSVARVVSVRIVFKSTTMVKTYLHIFRMTACAPRAPNLNVA